MSSTAFSASKSGDRHIRLKSATYTSVNEPILNAYDSNWKDIIFLPFNSTWRFFITLSIIFNGAITVYDIAYHSEKSNMYLFLFLETLYAIDVALYISHRNMEHHRILREHEPRHMYRLLFDVITLIPLSLMYSFVMTTSRRKPGLDAWPELLKIPSIFRFYRIQEYLNDLSYNAGVNQKIVICLGQATKLLIWMHLVGAQFYLMVCWKCGTRNWSENLRDVMFDSNDPKEWLGIILVFVGSLFAHNFRGYIRGEHYIERIIIIGVMFTGFVLHFMIFFGNLISIFTKTFRRKHVFVDRLHSIQFMLKEWKVSNACAKRTIEYYKVFWDRRMGLRKPPEVFRLLPLPLQKEVTLDVFWEALRHSHLFASEEMCVKRMISSNMKAEFFLPGDFVYRASKVKSKMVYIASGILQILTAEDEESPILSLSAGTVLGEICCLRPMPSVANVRCATYCELHTLSSRDLYNALGDNSSKAKELLTRLQKRIDMADYLYHIKKKTIFMTTDEETFERTEDTSIKWLKQQWRNLMEVHERSSKKKSSTKYVQDLSYLYEGPWHCSDFLNLLALSKEVELKMQSICLTGHCPFVMEPSSSFLQFWSYINLTAVMVQSLIVPYQFCFNEKISPNAFMFCFGLDLIYFLDLYLKLSTAIKKSEVLIDTPGLILLERLKDFYFAIDLISTLPIDYFMYYQGRKYTGTVLKLNRLLKMNEVFRFVSGKEQNIWLDPGTTRLVKYVFIYAFTGYWFSCYLYATSNFGTEFSRLSQFVHSVLYTLSGYFGVGIISTFEYDLFRMINYYCLIMTGYYVFSFCFCEISASSVLRLGKRRRYQEFLKATNNYMWKNRIFGELRQKITSILHFNWYYNENEKLEDIFEDATDELWDEVVHKRIESCFKMVPLFHGFEEQVVVKTAKAAKLKTLPREVVVTVSNATSNWMYVILRGYCELTSIMAGDRERKAVTVLKANDAFSAIEMLHQVPSLVSVKTVTSVELAYVSYDDFRDIVNSSAEAKKTLTATIEWHMEKYDAALNRRRCRLPPMIPSEKSYGQGEMFTYEVYDYLREDAAKTAYFKPFSKLGNLSFIRFLLMKRTINPHNKYFKVYECFHCCVCVFRVSMGLTFTNLLIEYRPVTDIALRVMEVLFVTNMYIRMHIRYYNQDGILVTHPWFTCKNYLSGAFLLDALTIIPFRKLKIDRILGFRRRDVVYNILLMTVRPLMLYRPLQGLSYLQSNINSSYGIIQFLRYTMIVIMTMMILTTVLQRCTCIISTVGKPAGPLMVECPNSTWMANSPFGLTMRPQNLYTRCFYVVAMLFTAATCGLFDPMEHYVFDVLVFIALFTVLALLKVIVWAEITSHRITGNVNLTIFQERVKSFLKFLERESIDEDLIKTTVDHYEYIWKRTQGTNTQNIFQDFHPQLHQDISYFLYSSTLNNVEFFQGASEGFIRNFGMHLNETLLRKDSVIIQCNDVQGMMYMVYKGSVDLKVASMRICNLGRGGVFGCFERQGLTRQTIKATAKVHTSLLTINSNHFHKLISKYPTICKKVEETTFLSPEFVKGHSAIREAKEEDVSSVGEMSSSVNVHSTAKFRFISIFTKLHFVIYHEKPWYLVWEYAVSVHVAPLSSVAIMFLITMPLPQFISTQALLIGYSIELLFHIKTFISFHVTYLEPESGILIKDHSLIWRRYAWSLSGFGIDLISCFPFELIILLFTRDRTILKWSKINRVLRFFHLVKYYKEREEGANVKANLRWTYLLYWVVYSIQIMTSIWWFTANENNQVHYLNSTKQSDKFNYVKADRGFESVVLSYYYVINLFTSTGMRDAAPTTPSQLLVSIIMMMWVQFILIGLTSSFATVLSIAHYTMNHYEYSIEQVRTYWQRLDLSPPIVKNMWRYFLQLWQRQRGEWMPHLLTEAPSYLKQDLMFSLYGGHLTKHFLFCDTHVDLLRQLVVHLRRCLFFPGNHLVEKGDVDGSMYFIHKGEVDVYETNGSNTFLIMTVHKGDSFGELQGLHRVPHDFSYKARTVVDAIILKHEDWQYLLQWFPASNERIQKRARDHRLVVNTDDLLSRTSNRTDDEDEEEVVFGAASASRESVRVIHKFL